MTEMDVSANTVRVLEYDEKVLFPDGKSHAGDAEVYEQYDTVLQYITMYPNYKVDPTSLELLGAKLGAVASVKLDRADGVPTRPDLAKAISDRNYSSGHILAVSQNAIKRVLSRGKEHALSEATVDYYASRYSERGVDGLATDTVKFAMSELHMATASQLLDLQKELGTLIQADGLKGAKRQLKELALRNNFLATDPATAGKSFDIDILDRQIKDAIEVINRLGRQELGGRALDIVGDFGERMSALRDMRVRVPFAYLADSQDSRLIFKGRNADRLQTLEIHPPKRDEVAVSKPTAEAIEAMRQRAAEEAERRRAESQQEQARQAQLEAERIAAIDAENEPILERINQIAKEYRELADVVYGYNRKLLREKHVLGQDSVMGRMLAEFSSSSKETIEDAARLYAGLTMNAEAITSYEELVDWLNKVTELRSLYDATCDELVSGGNSHELPSLGADIARDMLWLDTNFEQMYVSCIADCRKHMGAVGEGAVDRVIRLLGRGGEPDTPEEKAENDDQHDQGIEMSEVANEVPESIAPPTLAEVRALAETVDWTIMPGESVTREDLRKVICETQLKSKKGSEVADELLLDERLQMILDWRKEYDARLVYSSDKMMDETGNFYFVLTFTRDGKNYAIAENPVYRNATYVMAEHLMPLVEGESLLTVVKELRRKSIRSLSGRQIIHRDGPMSHPEKVEAVIQELSVRSLD